MLLVLFAVTLAVRAEVPQATVKDKVYTKEQSTRGATLFNQACAKCHLLRDPKPSDVKGKDDGPSLAGDEFLTKWDGKSVFEMATGIRLNMPPDGSTVVDADQAADLIAHILQTNGFPDGTQPLKIDNAARQLTFVKK